MAAVMVEVRGQSEGGRERRIRERWRGGCRGRERLFPGEEAGHRMRGRGGDGWKGGRERERERAAVTVGCTLVLCNSAGELEGNKRVHWNWEKCSPCLMVAAGADISPKGYVSRPFALETVISFARHQKAM